MGEVILSTAAIRNTQNFDQIEEETEAEDDPEAKVEEIEDIHSSPMQ